jgi:hypothetical protein
MSSWGDDVDEWEPELLITSSCDSVTVSEFKPGKQGLNSRLRPVLRGNGSHTLPNHVTKNRRSTRYSRWVIKPRPGALLEIFSCSIQIAVRLIKHIHCFLWLGKTISQVRFLVIQDCCTARCSMSTSVLGNESHDPSFKPQLVGDGKNAPPTNCSPTSWHHGPTDNAWKKMILG